MVKIQKVAWVLLFCFVVCSLRVRACSFRRRDKEARYARHAYVSMEATARELEREAARLEELLDGGGGASGVTGLTKIA